MIDPSVQASADAHPDRVALLGDGRTWTWSELAAAVDEVAATWTVPDRSGPTRCVVDGRTDTRSVIRVLAALEPNRVAFLRHPRWAADRRKAMTSAAGPAYDVDAGVIVDGPALPLSDPDASAVVYTSGSTTGPKGVVLSRAGIAASAAGSGANLGWFADDRWLLCLPTAHVGGLSVLTRCRAAGASVVCVPSFDIDSVVTAIDRGRATLASLVPTMLRRLLLDRPDWRPPAHLRAVLTGGSATPPALVAEARSRGIPVLLTWGLTEAGSQVCTQRPSQSLSSRADDLTTCGRPLSGFEVVVRDGRLCVRGEAVSRVRFPADAASWLPADAGETSIDSDGFLRTSDAGHVAASGDVRVLGRVDDAILSGGELVNPSGVEAVLAAHPAVAEACVVGVPDEEWGQRVAAAVVWRAEAIAWPDLDAWVRGRVADFAVPRRWQAMRGLPLGPNGKIDRAAVAATLASDASTSAR